MNDNDKKYIEGLCRLSKDKGKMASIRRVLNPDASRVAGLGIIASLGVDVSTVESLPYKAVAFLFGKTKITTHVAPSYNFGHSLRICVKKEQTPKEGCYPFDKRFDSMVACTSVERLVKHHLMRLQRFISDTPVNYFRLLQDLKYWNKETANSWISGYYQ